MIDVPVEHLERPSSAVTRAKTFWTNRLNARSGEPQVDAHDRDAMMTTTVPEKTWRWLGHSTFFSSAHDSR